MSATILIEDFADAKYEWYSVTDSVIQHHHHHHNHTHPSLRVGESESIFSIDNGLGLGILDGEVKVVDYDKNDFHGPGFLSMRTGKGNYLGAGGNIMPDVSSCTALQLVARSSEPYGGLRISFGSKYVPFLIPNRRGYKANVDLPVGDTTTVTIPFNQFTLFWDGATGDAMVTCGNKPEYCPDTDNLKNMKTITIWAQGVAGKVHLEVESISATGCGSFANTSVVPRKSALIQSNSSSSNGTYILAAFVGITILGVIFAFVRRQRNAGKEYQGMERFLVDCPENIIPVQTPGTWCGGQRLFAS